LEQPWNEKTIARNKRGFRRRDVDRYTLIVDAMVVDRCGIVPPDFNEGRKVMLRMATLTVQCTERAVENQRSDEPTRVQFEEASLKFVAGKRRDNSSYAS